MMNGDSETTVPESTSRELLEEMVRIRRFENRVSELYSEGDVPGFMHVSNGHEGSHAGIGAARDADDWWCLGGARIHGQGLAAGMTMKEILAEVYGKETGSNHGKGGHMHISNVDINLYGSAATIGQGANPGAGLGLAQDMLDTGQAVIVVLGDGGTTRGTFHPALNLAALWELPVVFVIENNRYAMSFATEERMKPRNLADHAGPHGIPAKTIDGSEVETVYNTITDALERVRSGDGPMVVEHKVHRLEGHYVGDKEVYRRENMDEIREKHDPLEKYRRTLLEDGWLTAEEYEAICDRVDEEIEEAVEFAQNSSFPDASEAYEDLYKRPLYGQEEE